RQIQLARLLGRSTPPRFLHHPLVMKTPTQKLSKADADTSLRDLRAGGATAEALIGQAAWLAGLTRAPRPMPAADVADLFARDAVSGLTVPVWPPRAAG